MATPQEKPFSPWNVSTLKLYLGAGWKSVLPMIAKDNGKIRVDAQGNYELHKHDPPWKYTGGNAPLPDLPQYKKWISDHDNKPGWRANIALKLPNDVVILDVDTYEAKDGSGALASLLRELNIELPATYRNTARGQDRSAGGHLFFRVPDEYTDDKVKWPGKLCPGVDILRAGHRYAVVWPSKNPQADGAEYRWYRDIDEPMAGGEIPKLADLPLLPVELCEYATKGEQRRQFEKLDVSSDQVAEWLDSCVDPRGEPCHEMAVSALGFDKAVTAGHDGINEKLWHLFSLAYEGHSGILTAVRGLYRAWTSEATRDATGHRVRSLREFEAEWRRMYEGGVAKILSRGNLDPADVQQTECMCQHLENFGFSISKHLDNSPIYRRTLDDFGNADRLFDHFGPIIRWALDAQCWFVYNGKVWERYNDDVRIRWFARMSLERAATQEALLYPDQVMDDGPEPEPESDSEAKKSSDGGEGRSKKKKISSERKAFIKWIKSQRRASYVRNMVVEFKSNPKIHVKVDEFDQNQWLFNMGNGTFDILTGEFAEHSPEDMLSQISFVTYDEGALCPKWDRFLKQVQPEEERRLYLARAVGYSLTGSTREEAMFIHHGKGANGKSVFLRVMSEVFGQFFQTIPKSLLLSNKQEDHPTGLARIVGKRFLSASETKAGKMLDDEFVKSLSSGDMQTARFMGQNFFDFHPVGKIHLATNFLPNLSTSGEAIGRRIRAIGWDVQIAEADRDKDLAESIIGEELEGVTQWVLRGARIWLSRGLDEPESVREKVREYIDDSNPLSDWLVDNAIIDESAVSLQKELYDDFKYFCIDSGMKPPVARVFSKLLVENGFERMDRQPGTGRAQIRGLYTRDKNPVKYVDPEGAEVIPIKKGRKQ